MQTVQCVTSPGIMSHQKTLGKFLCHRLNRYLSTYDIRHSDTNATPQKVISNILTKNEFQKRPKEAILLIS